ncbi:MAG: TrpB-like pyridoxal phosphate-dependent enzyme [bacterium]
MHERKILLSEKEIPRYWYNILPELKVPLSPPLNPGTQKPIDPSDLAAIFPMALIEQEMSPQAEIPIPEELMDIYALWRPTPMFRAFNLEKALDTPAKIYYKYEGVSPPGSHKPNTAVAQAYYNKQAGIKRLATETGAGQWGSALSFACSHFGMECKVYMVKVSYQQKPYRRSMMEVWGSTVVASPSRDTQAGRSILDQDPDSLGSLGIAISEAVEDAATHEGTNYALGSVLNHVLLHQTIVGLETKKQFEKIKVKPNVIIGCCGGGSNYGGFMIPFVRDKMAGADIRFVAVEPTACPTFTKGEFRYDFGDTAKMTPLMKMYTLGHDFVPAGIHAGGLRYHGDAPLLSHLVKQGIVEAVAYHQNPVFDSALLFAKTEGIIPAPEAAHAIKAAIEEAMRCKEEGTEKVIAFNLSGHGYFDLAAYDAYLSKKLEDYEHPGEKIKEALSRLPVISGY